jgi:Tfp pilus assembly protein PilO
MRRWRVPAAGAEAALLLVVGYYIGFHQPRGEDIAAAVDETEQLRAQQVPVRREIAGLETVAAREPEFRSALQLLEHLMPSGLAQPDLLAQLQRAADAAEVELVSVTFGDPMLPERAPGSSLPGTVLVALPVTVVANGQFGGITELLRRVEADVDRAVLVGTVALTEGEAGFPELTGTWSGQAFALLAADDPLLAGAKAPTPSSDEPASPTTTP